MPLNKWQSKLKKRNRNSLTLIKTQRKLIRKKKQNFRWIYKHGQKPLMKSQNRLTHKIKSWNKNLMKLRRNCKTMRKTKSNFKKVTKTRRRLLSISMTKKRNQFWVSMNKQMQWLQKLKRSLVRTSRNNLMRHRRSSKFMKMIKTNF